MPWRINYHPDGPPEHKRVGDMWPAPWMVEGKYGETEARKYLSTSYYRDHFGKRPPLVVKLPDGSEFCVDSQYMTGGVGNGNGWTVTGTPPLITVAPSVNIVGSYHGWISNGEISNDVEGRSFK
jgi:hypothetical protein